MPQISVLIVGGGPSGLVMACELARYGVPFRIIDKKPEPTLTSNAAGIQTRTLELFDHMGLLERFLQKGTPCTSIVVNMHNTLAKISLDHLDSLYQYILMLPQAETERILIQRLAEFGYQVERSLEFIGMTQHENSIHAEIKMVDATIETIVCDWLIACDGAHSGVRSACEISFVGEDINEQFLVADVKLNSALPQNAIHLFANSGEILAIFPFDHEHYRLAINLPMDNSRSLPELVSERGQGEYRLDSVAWKSPFWIHSKVIDRLREGRVFFVGDAAHIHSPIGGQGMNTGIQDAYNLAWKIAYVFNGYASAAILDSYQEERLPVVTAIVRATERMTNVMISKGKVMQFIKTMVLKFIRNKRFILDKMMMRVTQLSISYSHSSIIQYQNASDCYRQPGQRAPNVLMTGSRRLHDYLKHTKHTILLFVGQSANQSAIDCVLKLRDQIVAQYRVLTECYVVASNSMVANQHVIDDVGDVVHQCYGVKKGAIYIIRPDHYIGACSRAIDMTLIAEYMRGI